MNSWDEASQLFLVIVFLLAIYLGIRLWSNRSKKAGAAGAPHSNLPGIETPSTEMDARMEDALSSRSGRKQNEKRFNLQGRDAEVAARVLRRMLKKDQKNRGD